MKIFNLHKGEDGITRRNICHILLMSVLLFTLCLVLLVLYGFYTDSMKWEVNEEYGGDPMYWNTNFQYMELSSGIAMVI